MWAAAWTLGHSAFKLNYPYTGNHNTCTEGFSSAHPGGAFFAFCDGSVHWVNDDVDYDPGPNASTCTVSVGTKCLSQKGNRIIGIYQRLSWRDDGMEIGGGDY